MRPIQQWAQSLRRTGICRFLDRIRELFPGEHLKDQTFEQVFPGRRVVIAGREVVNFGSDSFLGLDEDPRVQRAIADGTSKWGTHSGASRAFASVATNVEVEQRIARWLGAEAAVVYPSVTLANLGAIPGLVERPDVVVCDVHAHNSVQEGAKIAQANGVRCLTFAHDDPEDLRRLLQATRPCRHALVAIDGVYSMSGSLPPLEALDEVARAHGGALYVDDAHGTGVLGERGRGTVFGRLSGAGDALVVGSLSKAFSCMGGFVACPGDFYELLKMRSNTYIFGGPVPPPYLDGLLAALDIIDSPEYELLRARLDTNRARLVAGTESLGYQVLGGTTPIVSLMIGDEAETLGAGYFLFERGFFVQSVTFPAVPFRSGVLRIQVNSNHAPAAVDGLLAALTDLSEELSPAVISPRSSRRAA